MPKLIYTPKALDDLRGIKAYAKQLELFPEEGLRLEELIEYPTDYHYLVVKPNYVFYRYYSELAVYLKKEKVTGEIKGI